MAAMSAILKIFKQQTVSWIELKLDGRHRSNREIQNFFLLKLFRSDTQDGPHGGHFENLQTVSASEW